MKHRFIIIGMDDNRSPFFPPEALAQIRKGKVFSGGIRHKEIVGPLLPAGAEWISITVPLERVFSRYEEIFAHFEETATDDSIIVFASGDPLFFGFANTIKRKLPEADILLYPAFNSLQTLAHRLVMPYDDMRTVSLTGRPWQELDKALIERAHKIGVLTDREHTPATIAARMLEYGYTDYTIYIGEHLGNPEHEVFLGRDFNQQAMSPETAAKVDAEMKSILDECYDTARNILSEHRDLLDNMVKVLFAKETIFQNEVDMLFEGKTPEEIIKLSNEKSMEKMKAAEASKAEEKTDDKTEVGADDKTAADEIKKLHEKLKEKIEKIENKEKDLESQEKEIVENADGDEGFQNHQKNRLLLHVGFAGFIN